nr:subunit VI of cytochrome b6/f complex [Haslea pseudostrearia]UXN44589.1 subunit VI of cytochrome b6/f complex [Haslea pseudostrearia]
MTIAIDYFLLIAFCFALTSGLFIGFKSIKLI